LKELIRDCNEGFNNLIKKCVFFDTIIYDKVYLWHSNLRLIFFREEGRYHAFFFSSKINRKEKATRVPLSIEFLDLKKIIRKRILKITK
jgi:hypothetical protein